MIPINSKQQAPQGVTDLTDPESFFKLCKNKKQDKFYECLGCSFYDHPRTREQEILSKGVDILIVGERPSEEDIPFPGKDSEYVGYEFKAKKWYGFKKFIKNNSLSGNKIIKFALTNAVMCYDKKNKTRDYPIKVLKQCGSILNRKIFYSGAKVVLLMGRQSCKSSPVSKLQKITSIDYVRGKIYKEKSGDRTVYYIPTHSLKDVNRSPDLWSTVLHDLNKSIEIFKNGFSKPPINELVKDYVYPKNIKELRDILDPLIDEPGKLVSFDIETTGLNSRALDAKITVFSFCWATRQSCAVSMDKASEEMLNLIKDFLKSSTKKIAHNAQFDIEYIKEIWGVHTEGLYADTMLTHYLLDENRSGGEERTLKGEFTLKKLVWDFLPEYGGYEEEGDIASYFKKGKGDQIPEKILLKYAAIDADVTLQIFFKQLRIMFNLSLDSPKDILKKELANPLNIREKKLYELATKFMPRATYAVVHLKNQGMYIDENYLDKLLTDIPAKIDSVQEFVRTHSGKDTVSLSNPRDVSWVLYQHLGLPVLYKTPTGAPKTDFKTLSSLNEMNQNKVIDAIVTFKKLHKLNSSFLKNIKLLRNLKTGRVHPSYLLIGTVTGRLSCMSPNLQQIPKYIGLPDGSSINVKKLFSAPKGKILLYADYSQVEMMVMAALSAKFGDSSLKEAILNGLDVHSYVAGKVFSVDYDEMFDKAKVKEIPEYVTLRSRAKTVGFAILYGSTSWGMAKKQNITPQEAQGLIDGFLGAFPGIKKFVEFTHREASQYGYVMSPFGRRRRFPISKVRSYIDNSSKRKAQNFPIQSGASDICLRSVIGLTEKIKDCGGKVVVTVHDSLICEVDDDAAIISKTANLMKEIMVTKPNKAYGFLEGIPLKADIEVGYNWGELKQYLGV